MENTAGISLARIHSRDSTPRANGSGSFGLVEQHSLPDEDVEVVDDESLPHLESDRSDGLHATAVDNLQHDKSPGGAGWGILGRLIGAPIVDLDAKSESLVEKKRVLGDANERYNDLEQQTRERCAIEHGDIQGALKGKIDALSNELRLQEELIASASKFWRELDDAGGGHVDRRSAADKMGAVEQLLFSGKKELEEKKGELEGWVSRHRDAVTAKTAAVHAHTAALGEWDAALESFNAAALNFRNEYI